MAELITLTTGQKVVGTIPQYPDPDGFVAEDGTPARIGSVPVWQSMDPNAGTVTVDADGMTNIQVIAAAVPVGDPPRSTQVKMSVDVDLGEGADHVTTVEFLYDLVVSALPAQAAARLGKPLFGAPIPV